MDKRGGGSITIFCRSFCLTVPKYFIGEHFGVSEKFFYRKFSCIGGGHHGFVGTFLSHRTETKSFVQEPFCFPEIFWYRKKIMDKRGHITIFSRNFYVSQCRKNSWASLQCFRKFVVSKNFMHNRGITSFRRKFFVSQCRNISWTWASLQCIRKFGVSKNFMHNRGYHNFPSKIFCLTVPKNFVGMGIPSMFQKIWGIQKFYA